MVDPQVLLVVLVLGQGLDQEWPMPDMATCQASVDNSRIVIPNGDENEHGTVMLCVFEDKRPGWIEWLKETVL